MIRSVTVTNHLGEEIYLDLARPELSGLAVKSIEGLGPVKANVTISESSMFDGGHYVSSRTPTRNIVINLAFLPEKVYRPHYYYPSSSSSVPPIIYYLEDDYYFNDVEDTRHKTYVYFPVKKRIKLAIETDTRIYEATGIVESNEPDIFSKEEGCSISILCNDPNLYGVDIYGDNALEYQKHTGIFEFPFSNESLTNDELYGERTDTLEIGVITEDYEQHILYDGGVDTGITITISSLGVANNIRIANEETNQMITIDTDRIETLTGQKLSKDDRIVICTIRNNKSAILYRNDEEINILSCLGMNTEWIYLRKGDNKFSFAADSGMHNLKFRIDYQIAYEGV